MSSLPPATHQRQALSRKIQARAPANLKCLQDCVLTEPTFKNDLKKLSQLQGCGELKAPTATRS